VDAHGAELWWEKHPVFRGFSAHFRGDFCFSSIVLSAWGCGHEGIIKIVDFFDYLRHIESMVKQRIAYIGIILASLVLCGAVVFPPIWIRSGHGPDFASAAGYFFFSGVCHQIPARSFHVWGEPLAVCARCTGVYAGFLAGTLVFPLIPKGQVPRGPVHKGQVRKGLKGDFPPAWILGSALLPATADFALGHFGLYDSGNVVRLITGLIPGAAASFFMIPAVFEIVSGPSQTKGLTCRTNPAN
jgi:uncharacterized membrane protein